MNQDNDKACKHTNISKDMTQVLNGYLFKISCNDCNRFKYVTFNGIKLKQMGYQVVDADTIGTDKLDQVVKDKTLQVSTSKRLF